MAWLMPGVIEYNEFENMIQKLLHCPRKSVPRRQECFLEHPGTTGDVMLGSLGSSSRERKPSEQRANQTIPFRTLLVQQQR